MKHQTDLFAQLYGADQSLLSRADADARTERHLLLLEVGRAICFSGGKAPKADPNVGKAALKNAELGEEWLAWTKQTYAESKPRQDQMDDLSMKVAAQGLEASKFNDEQARETWKRYNDKVVPLENQVFEEAGNAGSEADQARAAGRASADVEAEMAAARQGNAREMARMGINPASARYQNTADTTGIIGSLGSAAAENNAREMARERGIVLRQNATALGKGMPMTAGATFGVSQNAGGGALGALNTAGNAQTARQGIMAQGFQGGMQGYSNQASILNTDYANRLNAYQINQSGKNAAMGALGTVAGAAIMASDRRLKTDIVEAGHLANGLPLYEYTYVWGGERQVGVMADEVQKVVPSAVMEMPGGYLAVDYSQLGQDAVALLNQGD